MKKTPHILVAVLNWGLGHASRCIPIINELLQQGAKVSIASEGRTLALLEKEFPHLGLYTLPAYDITYKNKNMFWNIGKQLPKIARAIYKEHRAIRKLVQEQRIDAIISDNRFGCYDRRIPSIFITHQICIKIPFFPLEYLVNICNHQCIYRFNACWIPDFEPPYNLAGSLSIPPKHLHSIKYLGALSRMTAQSRKIEKEVIIILSGPEPQRTYLEELLIEQAQTLPQNFLLIQGKTESYQHFKKGKNIEVKSFLTGKELNKAINSSDLIISRSGYSTIMDLYQLSKKAILIPTPGQTEQEYLAAELFKKSYFYTQSQVDFNLEEALLRAKEYQGFSNDRVIEKRLHETIQSFLAEL